MEGASGSMELFAFSMRCSTLRDGMNSLESDRWAIRISVGTELLIILNRLLRGTTLGKGQAMRSITRTYREVQARTTTSITTRSNRRTTKVNQRGDQKRNSRLTILRRGKRKRNSNEMIMTLMITSMMKM